ncbi:MAG: hypothetical protein R2942_01415 [Ignavibacteria bacterium]
MTSTATTGYNICFNQATGATFNTALYTKRLSATTFNFGIRKSLAVSYSNTVYNTNTTYLVVVKYSFVNGSNVKQRKKCIYIWNYRLQSHQFPQHLKLTHWMS